MKSERVLKNEKNEMWQKKKKLEEHNRCSDPLRVFVGGIDLSEYQTIMDSAVVSQVSVQFSYLFILTYLVFILPLTFWLFTIFEIMIG